MSGKKGRIFVPRGGWTQRTEIPSSAGSRTVFGTQFLMPRTSPSTSLVSEGKVKGKGMRPDDRGGADERRATAGRTLATAAYLGFPEDGLDVRWIP